MRQPEEVEGLRCTGLALFLPLSGGKPPEPKKPGFVRMQLQSELRESFVKVPEEPLCIVGTLEAEHESSSGGESHPSALTEPYLRLSLHTAPTIPHPVAHRTATGRTSSDPVTRFLPANAWKLALGGGTGDISVVPRQPGPH